MAIVEYTRTYRYHLSDEILTQIKAADRTITAIVILKRHVESRGTNFGLEVYANICKTIRGIEIEDFVYPFSGKND